MRTVRDILDVKGREVYSIAPHATVFEALKLLAERDIGALVVMDAERLVGIMSERDYARKVTLVGKSSKDIAVQDIMTSSVICVDPENTVEECMALMTNKRIRHLPVCDADRIVGLISIGDVVKSIIEEQKVEIQDLRNYITGKYPV